MGTDAVGLDTRTEGRSEQAIELPAPTVWPFVLALGVTLLFAGLVTTVSVSVLGVLFAISGCIGWFRDVLPEEKHELVPVSAEVASVVTARTEVARVKWMTQELHYARLPLEIYPISAGVKGGLAGSVVMAILAMLYGIVSGRGIWYPVNLLSVGFFPAKTTIEQIAAFSWETLIIAAIIHLLCSLLVGLLYGVMLPMLPRHPIVLGGLIAPVLWSGVIHSTLEAVDPVLNSRISWVWFVFSQIGFGIVAGIVVSRQEHVRTMQLQPFAVRAGIKVAEPIVEKGANDSSSDESHHSH